MSGHNFQVALCSEDRHCCAPAATCLFLERLDEAKAVAAGRAEDNNN
jgi:hypothetical protein